MTPAELEAIRKRINTPSSGYHAAYADRRYLVSHVDELLKVVAAADAWLVARDASYADEEEFLKRYDAACDAYRAARAKLGGGVMGRIDDEAEAKAWRVRAEKAEAERNAALARVKRLDAAIAIVAEQAEDGALWDEPIDGFPIGEAYVLQELRRLHKALEGEAP